MEVRVRVRDRLRVRERVRATGSRGFPRARDGVEGQGWAHHAVDRPQLGGGLGYLSSVGPSGR